MWGPIGDHRRRNLVGQRRRGAGGTFGFDNGSMSMKLLILSDLHLEFAAFDSGEAEADVVVLAGDIDVKDRGIRWAMTTFKDRPVLYVLGNHEFFRRAYPRHVLDLKRITQGTTVRVLEDDATVIDGVRFLGSTFWTDFALFGNPPLAGYEATQYMTDYRKIRVSPSYRRLRSIDTATIHARSKHWLSKELGSVQRMKTVVITHHAPSARSLPLSYSQDLVSAAYASPLDEFVKSSGAALWIHGHVHRYSDYMIGSTRVVCNPRGYPRERTDWNPGLVIDV